MDLHPFVDSRNATIEFQVIRQGRFFRVDVPRDAVNRQFGVPDGPHGLLEAYATHRVQIDAAVMRLADECNNGVTVVRSMDLVPMAPSCVSRSTLDSMRDRSEGLPVHKASIARRSAGRQVAITRAVFAYLKATRAPSPGAQTRANTAQIAEALSLPRRAVDRALLSLGERCAKVSTATGICMSHRNTRCVNAACRQWNGLEEALAIVESCCCANRLRRGPSQMATNGR